jgi:hypothetical protein
MLLSFRIFVGQGICEERLTLMSRHLSFTRTYDTGI